MITTAVDPGSVARADFTRAGLHQVRVGVPVFLHGSHEALEPARHWLNARGCPVLGYVDTRPTAPRTLHDVSELPRRARIVIYGVGRDGVHFFERLGRERPDVAVVGLVDDRGAAAIATLPPGPTRRRLEALPVPVPLASFTGADASLDLFV
ncbi:MAG TPA: hypothetical protein VGF45_19840, partial [Polyangia bacterium]